LWQQATGLQQVLLAPQVWLLQRQARPSRLACWQWWKQTKC
jgi:hypothetical protein